MPPLQGSPRSLRTHVSDTPAGMSQERATEIAETQLAFKQLGALQNDTGESTDKEVWAVARSPAIASDTSESSSSPEYKRRRSPPSANPSGDPDVAGSSAVAAASMEIDETSSRASTSLKNRMATLKTRLWQIKGKHKRGGRSTQGHSQQPQSPKREVPGEGPEEEHTTFPDYDPEAELPLAEDVEAALFSHPPPSSPTEMEIPTSDPEEIKAAREREELPRGSRSRSRRRRRSRSRGRRRSRSRGRRRSRFRGRSRSRSHPRRRSRSN